MDTISIPVFTFAEICALLQKMPRQIRGAMADMELTPAYVLNGQACWSQEQVDRIGDQLKEKEACRHAKS